MTLYRHNRVPGATYFFTVRLLDHKSCLLTEHIAAFGEAIRQVRARKPFHVDAWVVLPDHTHAIWTLPPGDSDTAGRWRAVKIAFSKAVRKAGVWSRYYQDHAVQDDAEYAALVDYVHGNPLRHGLCTHPLDWRWSSAHRFRSMGLLTDHTGHELPPGGNP